MRICLNIKVIQKKSYRNNGRWTICHRKEKVMEVGCFFFSKVLHSGDQLSEERTLGRWHATYTLPALTLFVGKGLLNEDDVSCLWDQSNVWVEWAQLQKWNFTDCERGTFTFYQESNRAYGIVMYVAVVNKKLSAYCIVHQIWRGSGSWKRYWFYRND